MKKFEKELEELRNLKATGDYFENFETDHIEADEILCKILLELGYDEIVEAYNQVGKWYS